MSSISPRFSVTEKFAFRAGHTFLLVETSTQLVACVQFNSAGKRFTCATSERLLVVARALPNT